MGKYSDALAKNPLPKREGSTEYLTDPGFKQFVDMKEVELSHFSKEELLGMLRAKDNEKVALEAQISKINVDMEAIKRLLIKRFETEGVNTIKIEGVGTGYTQPEPHVSVTDKEALRKWAIKNKLSALLTIPWQQLNALCKERLLEGKKVDIPGTKLELFTKFVLRKG